MNFELGKEYIVNVSKEGIIPIEEFDSDRFYDKDHDDLDFLTDEEKAAVVNDILNDIKAEIEQKRLECDQNGDRSRLVRTGIDVALRVINKYM